MFLANGLNQHMRGARDDRPGVDERGQGQSLERFKTFLKQLSVIRLGGMGTQDSEIMDHLGRDAVLGDLDDLPLTTTLDAVDLTDSQPRTAS